MKIANSILLLPVLLVLGGARALGSLTSVEENLISEAKQGQILHLPELLAERSSLPRVAVQISLQPGEPLLFSDRPEYFSRDGIALQEMVQPGKARVYIYHVPQPDAGPRTITAVLKNCGSNTLNFHLLRSAVPLPGKDYQRIALEGLLGFLSSQPLASNRLVRPGESCALDSHLDKTTAAKDQLVHAFLEFEIDQPALVSVFQRPPDQDSLQILPRLPLLFSDPDRRGNGAGRGIFTNADFTVENARDTVIETTNGPAQLIVADGKTDPWIRGHDGIDQQDSRNAGNYGVFYHIRLHRRAGGPRGLALLLCKMQTRSPYCSRLGAAMEVSQGEWPAGVVSLPTGQTSFGNPGEAVLVQRFPPAASEGDSIEILYSPPGAACIPTPLVFVPYPWREKPR